jgi:uncharacterized phage protein (TIGR02218 family)
VKAASASLVALLNTASQFAMADLYTFTLHGGGIYRWSGGTISLADDQGQFFALGPKFERSKTKVTTGVQVDELDVNIYPEETDLLGGVPLLQAAWTGQLDGALLQVERAFMQPYGTVVGTVVLFAGRVSDVDCSRTGIDMKCSSHLELLNIQMPRRLWQPSCSHVFGDAMCQFNRASLAANFLASAGSTQTLLGGVPGGTTPYLQGTVTGIAGANAGQTRTVTAYSPGVNLSVKLAFLFPVAVGDEFQLLPGCDRSVSTCTNVFGNQAHFGGMPFIPAPENAV